MILHSMLTIWCSLLMWTNFWDETENLNISLTYNRFKVSEHFLLKLLHYNDVQQYLDVYFPLKENKKYYCTANWILNCLLSGFYNIIWLLKLQNKYMARHVLKHKLCSVINQTFYCKSQTTSGADNWCFSRVQSTSKKYKIICLMRWNVTVIRQE